MKKLFTYIKVVAMAIVAMATLVGCEYQPIYERERVYETAIIPVKINWAESGFDITSSGQPTKQSSASVHRATVRLFPTDGSEPIERYLEGNVFEGEIEVPVGEYNVIVMNESITDKYWEGSESISNESVAFESVDSYENFSAYVKTSPDNPAGFYFSSYVGTHLFMAPPLRLASWNLDLFTVTPEMAIYTHLIRIPNEVYEPLSEEDERMYRALTRDSDDDTDGIDIRKLTRDTKILLTVKNLTSTSYIKGGLIGYVNRVNMRAGVGYREPLDKKMIQYFNFNGRTNWYNEKGEYMGDGWKPVSGKNIYEDYTGDTSVNFISFGRDIEGEEEYMLDLDFIYISGTMLDKEATYFTLDIDRDPSTPLETVKLPFNVTKQVLSAVPPQHYDQSSGTNHFVQLGTIELEYTDGDISVEDWEDDDIIDL